MRSLQWHIIYSPLLSPAAPFSLSWRPQGKCVDRGPSHENDEPFMCVFKREHGLKIFQSICSCFISTPLFR